MEARITLLLAHGDFPRKVERCDDPRTEARVEFVAFFVLQQWS
jgi:hypothetical protein